MASVIERASADRLRRPTDEIVLSSRWGPVRLAPETMCAALDAARALGRSWQLDRDAFRSSILGLLLEGLERVRPDVLATREQLAEDLRNDRSTSSAIDRVWPTISAPAVVRQLLTSRAAWAAPPMASSRRTSRRGCAVPPSGRRRSSRGPQLTSR